MGGLKVLLVAPWGHPRFWKMSRYNIKDIRIAGRNIGGECEGCSSTISLYLLLKSRRDIQDAWLLAIGSDTVKRPTSNGSIRDDVKEWFERVSNELFSSTRCMGVEKDEGWVEDIFVEVVPGLGRFYGYNFRGSIIHMFIEAYRAITSYIEKLNPSILLLDTTHGLNILTITVLYAAVGASIIHDKRLSIINSEPYPSGASSKKCIEENNTITVGGMGGKKNETTDEVPALNLHDISALQWVIQYLRALAFLEYFNEKPLDRLLRSYENNEITRLKNIMERITCMIEAIRTGLAGLIFNNSRLSNGTSIPFTVRTITEMLEQLPVPRKDEPWIKPVLKGNIVEYEPTIKGVKLEYIPIIDALFKLMEVFGDLAAADSLREFGKRLGELLHRKGYWDKKQIVVHETSDLTEIARKILGGNDGEQGYVVTGEQLRQYWENVKGFKTGSTDGQDSKIPSPRNFAAHAALNHSLIEKIVLDRDREVVEVIYDAEKLCRVFGNEIGRKNTSLLKCLPQCKEYGI